MRYGVVSDVHGNLPALEAVVNDMPAVDRILCAGDLVGYNPWPVACVRWAKANSIPTVSGNHDRAAVAESGVRFTGLAAAGLRYTIEQLGADEVEWLRALPDRRRLESESVVLVHGHPDDRDRYTYPDDFSQSMLIDADAAVLIMGHTHVQTSRTYDAGIVMNPGSVGQPRDGDPRAAYSILDLDRMTVDERRVEYDVDRVVEAIEEAGLPRRLGRRLYEGR